MLTSNNLDHDDFIDMGTQCCFLPCENLSNLPDFLRFVGFVGRAAVLYSVTLEHVGTRVPFNYLGQCVAICSPVMHTTLSSLMYFEPKIKASHSCTQH